MQTWQLQTAKAQFSDVVRRAKDGPQDITVHGKSVAVVISRELFEKLSGHTESLVDFIRHSPLHAVEGIEFERDKSLSRDVEL